MKTGKCSPPMESVIPQAVSGGSCQSTVEARKIITASVGTRAARTVAHGYS